MNSYQDTTNPKKRERKHKQLLSKLTWGGGNIKKKGVLIDKGFKESRKESNTSKTQHSQRKYKKNSEIQSGTPKINKNGRKLPSQRGNPDSLGNPVCPERGFRSGASLYCPEALRFPDFYLRDPKTTIRKLISGFYPIQDIFWETPSLRCTLNEVF